ncbi:holo-ACP synthase [Corynebacterium sp. 3HC-13]|uniref:holo-ACP synthase AcpS n=1 Tax=Corynebacterium poyangense TaxID=2684405 RepID=UPI001CCAE559|nr:holo-ACP synthase [Corynebacterium poyangense]MBZ8178233.1 holo-ACP synthase [Corynebacterium poyangense]
MPNHVSVGVDLVFIPAFREQLEQPGSTFLQVFTPLERRIARGYRTPEARTEHLAGRWAAKEAFIKAWSQARYGLAPLMSEADIPFRQIEVRPDRWGRVQISPIGDVAAAIRRSLGDPQFALSISHDGDYAMAYCQWHYEAVATANR